MPRATPTSHQVPFFRFNSGRHGAGSSLPPHLRANLDRNRPRRRIVRIVGSDSCPSNARRGGDR